MKKFLVLILALGLMTLAACGGSDSSDKGKDKEKDKEEEVKTEQSAEVSDKEKVKDDKAVASVNGMEITGAEYNSIYSQLKIQLSNSQQDISDLDLLKKNTLDVLVKRELIRQESEKAGLEITEEEADAEMKSVKEELGDNFAGALEQSKITEEILKEQLQFELLIQKYVDTEFSDVKVTDKEVKEFYDGLKESEGEEEAPEFKEIEDTIKSTLVQQKQDEAFQTRIAELEEAAKIEELI